MAKIQKQNATCESEGLVSYWSFVLKPPVQCFFVEKQLSNVLV